MNRQIFSASVLISVLSLGVRSLAALKEVISAAIFGVGDDLDAFNVAFTLAALVTQVVAAAYQVSVVPVYLDVKRNTGQEAANKVITATMLVCCLSIITFLSLMAIGLPHYLPVMASGFGAQKLASTTFLWYSLIPMNVIGGMALILAGALNGEEKFTFAAVSPVLTSAATVIALVAIGRKYGAFSLAVGVVIGSVFEFIFLFWALRQLGIRIPLSFSLRVEGMRKVLTNALPVFGSAVAANFITVIEQSFAARLKAGDVAALGFGHRTISLVLGLMSMAVGSAVLPYFSKLAAARDWEGLKKVFLTNIYKFLLPITAIGATTLYLFSRPMIKLLFQRGAFTPEATQAVAEIQAMYALQLPAYAINIVGVRLLSAVQSSDRIIYTAIIMLTMSFFLNFYLSPILGVKGIALSNTISYYVAGTVTMVLVYRALNEKMKEGKAD